MATFDYNQWNPSVIWGYVYLRNCLQWSQRTLLATKQYFKATALKRNARTHPRSRHTSSSPVLIKQNHH